MAFFTENTVDHLALPSNSCLLNYSLLNEYYSPAPFRSFSVKYVVNGTELYSINGNRYLVKDREYILANQYSEGYVEVDSKKTVTGICIDVAPDILSEVLASYVKPDTAVSDLALDRFFNSTDFLENKYAAPGTHLGQHMMKLEKVLAKDPSRHLRMDREFYLCLAEKIVLDHVPVFKDLQRVKAMKTETKKDLLRKLRKAKEYMDLFYHKDLGIAHIAMEAGLSEYHFFRLFKTVYMLSPHQYLLQKRLLSAKSLIRTEGAGVSSAAVMMGFADIHSFSKAYKKYFGYAPSQDRNSRI